jgi:hypothetical protein
MDVNQREAAKYDLTPEDVAMLIRIADETMEADPEAFDPPHFNQPGRIYVEVAQSILGEDDAPWHQVATIAHYVADMEKAAT